ncbi:MAG: tetratricopeptide repeat protein [Bacteroidales bacterium]|nr:tetratricopeptide repeat protein [Bacteroidales bacterium]
MKRLLFLHIAVFSFFVGLFSQSLEETKIHAKALYQQGEYINAITDLRRVLFFGNNSDPEICLLLGDCYRNMHDAPKALYYYNLAFDLFSSDSMKLETKFNIVFLHLVTNEPNYSLTELFSLPDSISEKEKLRANLYFALAYYQLSDFELSNKYFLQSIGCIDNVVACKVDSLYCLAVKNYRFNVNLPMFLSIIPGFGQLYIGEYEAALNSFLLTALFGGLYVFSLANLSALDAVLTVVPWFHRYYQGGLLQAKSLAEKRKEYRNIEYYNALIDFYIDMERNTQ